MKIESVQYVFAAIGLLTGTVAAIGLYLFFGRGQQLGIAGISGLAHLAIFPIISMLVSGVVAAIWFGESFQGTRVDGFMRGATIALLAFLACIFVHAVLVLIRTDFEAALWLTLAALLFGGIVFGIPAMLLGGFVGTAFGTAK